MNSFLLILELLNHSFRYDLLDQVSEFRGKIVSKFLAFFFIEKAVYIFAFCYYIEYF